MQLTVAWSLLLAGALLFQSAAPGTNVGVWRGCDETRCLIDLEFTRLEVERPADRAAANEITAQSAVTVGVDRDTASVRRAPDGADTPSRVIRFHITGRSDITYGAIGGGHYVKSVSAAGDSVTLEDGSVWEIHPRLQFQVTEWEPSAGIAVRRTQPEDGFPYEMTNLDADEGVAARYRPR